MRILVPLLLALGVAAPAYGQSATPDPAQVEAAVQAVTGLAGQADAQAGHLLRLFLRGGVLVTALCAAGWCYISRQQWGARRSATLWMVLWIAAAVLALTPGSAVEPLLQFLSPAS